MDGDGHVDLAVGAPGDDTGGDEPGVVYIEYGPFEGIRQPGDPGGATIRGDRLDQHLGYAMAGGDTNGDGFDDLAVGMLTNDDTDPGSVWVFLGGP